MSYIQTLSGKKFDYVNATVDDIEIEDIATALSHICRFAGYLPEFYSVAQHSVLCSQLVEPEFAFAALTEAMDQNTAMASMVANLSEEHENG